MSVQCNKNYLCTVELILATLAVIYYRPYCTVFTWTFYLYVN